MSRATLKKKLDKLVGEIVRARGKSDYSGKTGILQCCHIFSRSNMSTRWDFDNLLCLTAGEHLYWAHKNPIEFTEWVKTFLGQEKYDRLRIRANTICQWKIYELEALYEKLKSQLPGAE